MKILIDRIVLDSGNLSPSQRRRLQTDIETELTYLLTANGIPDRLKYGKTVSNLSVHVDDVPSDMHSAKLGQSIAHSIYSELNR
jgi:hypothetical protein